MPNDTVDSLILLLKNDIIKAENIPFPKLYNKVYTLFCNIMKQIMADAPTKPETAEKLAKRAYYKLASRLHPDRNSKVNEHLFTEVFKVVEKAYVEIKRVITIYTGKGITYVLEQILTSEKATIDVKSDDEDDFGNYNQDNFLDEIMTKLHDIHWELLRPMRLAKQFSNTLSITNNFIDFQLWSAIVDIEEKIKSNKRDARMAYQKGDREGLLLTVNCVIAIARRYRHLIEQSPYNGKGGFDRCQACFKNLDWILTDPDLLNFLTESCKKEDKVKAISLGISSTKPPITREAIFTELRKWLQEVKQFWLNGSLCAEDVMLILSDLTLVLPLESNKKVWPLLKEGFKKIKTYCDRGYYLADWFNKVQNSGSYRALYTPEEIKNASPCLPYQKTSTSEQKNPFLSPEAIEALEKTRDDLHKFYLYNRRAPFLVVIILGLLFPFVFFLLLPERNKYQDSDSSFYLKGRLKGALWITVILYTLSYVFAILYYTLYYTKIVALPSFFQPLAYLGKLPVNPVSIMFVICCMIVLLISVVIQRGYHKERAASTSKIQIEFSRLGGDLRKLGWNLLCETKGTFEDFIVMYNIVHALCILHSTQGAISKPERTDFNRYCQHYSVPFWGKLSNTADSYFHYMQIYHKLRDGSIEHKTLLQLLREPSDLLKFLDEIDKEWRQAFCEKLLQVIQSRLHQPDLKGVHRILNSRSERSVIARYAIEWYAKLVPKCNDDNKYTEYQKYQDTSFEHQNKEEPDHNTYNYDEKYDTEYSYSSTGLSI